MTDFTYQDFSPNNSTVILKHAILDNSGNPIVPATTIAKYQIGTSDPATGVNFDDNYESFELGQNDHAVFYTTPTSVGNFTANDMTSLKAQQLDDDGNLIKGATTLKLNGKAGVKDLYQIGESSGADFGNSFLVAYSTYDPETGKSSIKYQQFDDSGDPIQGGLIENFDDGTHHGFSFGSFYGSTNPNSDGSPEAILQHRVASGEQLHVGLYDPSMNAIMSKTITDLGPNGEGSTSLDKYDYLKPGSGTSDNTALLSQTFQYQDAAGVTHEEIALEKVNPASLAVEAKTEFEDVAGTQTGVTMAHLTNGDYVVAYDDGGQTYLKEFNTKLQQIGQAYALPHDNDGYDNLVSLTDNSFEIFWRELASPSGSSQSVQHSAVLTTSQANHDIVMASSLSSHAAPSPQDLRHA